MSKIMLFSESEIAEPGDFENIGRFARQDVQALVGSAVGAPKQWARFTIAKTSAIQIAISKGHLFVDNVLYSADPVSLNLQIHLPLITGDLKWIAILIRGESIDITQNRLVETDADTGSTVLQTLPITNQLACSFVVQAGVSSPTPLRPVIAQDQACIAYVLLSTTGIMSIEQGEDWRLKSMFEMGGRIVSIETNFDRIKQRTQTLETDLSNLAQKAGTIPRPELMEQFSRDIAAMRRVLKMPSAARAYWYDNGLTLDDWDTTNALWSARVREGIRHPFAQIVDAQMTLATPADPKLKITNSIALPLYQEVARIAVEGLDGSKDISQQVHTITTAVQNTISGTSISYGPSFGACENKAEWAGVADVQAGQTFNVNGQTYVSNGLAKGSLTDVSTGQTADFGSWNASPESAGHKGYAIQQVQYSSWSQTYWTYNTKTYGVNGSIYGQTFLNSQPGIVTSIDLNFTRVGSDGDVHLFLCKTDLTGQPQFNQVLSQSTLSAAQLKEGWVNFKIDPTLLENGRYAWYVVTVGNHALGTVSDNKYAQGSLFWCTDGIWAQGDPVTDFPFRVNFAQFTTTRTVIDFAPLICPLGMTEIQLLYNGWSPAGTSLIWEIKPIGSNVWSTILTGDPTPLLSTPTQASLRATFVGTTDLMPALVLDNTSRAAAMRVNGSMQALSKVQNFGFSTSTVTLVTTLDRFDPACATYSPKLHNGTTYLTPSVTTVTQDYDKPLRRTVTSIFSLGTPVTSIRAAPMLSTSDLTKTPFVQDITMTAS